MSVAAYLGKVMSSKRWKENTSLFVKYKRENPQGKICFSLFCMFRPKHVLLVKFKNRRTCLCSKHQSMTMKSKKKNCDRKSEGCAEGDKCTVCKGNFNDDSSGQQWIMCTKCCLWSHETCWGYELYETPTPFICGLCF